MADVLPSGSFHPAPAGFRLRPARWEDLDAVATLHASAARARGRAHTLRDDDLRLRWLGLDRLDDVLLVERPETKPPLVGYSTFEVTHDPWDGQLDLHAEMTVHPDWTSRGIGTFLLEEAEERALAAGRAAGSAAVQVRTSLVDGDERTRAFFARRGFVPVRHLLDFRFDLHAPPPAPVWRNGVRARTFRPGRDERVLWEAHQAAFADVPTHLPLDLEEFTAVRLTGGPTGDPGFDPGLVLLAERGDEVVGVAVCRAGTEVAREDGWVRDLGVVPAWRRHGVGMALLRTAFAAFRARGLTGVALEVDDVTLDGAAALYRRAGMRTVARTDVLERTLSTTGPDAS